MLSYCIKNEFNYSLFCTYRYCLIRNKEKLFYLIQNDTPHLCKKWKRNRDENGSIKGKCNIVTRDRVKNDYRTLLRNARAAKWRKGG